jgi:hypothetical protein
LISEYLMTVTPTSIKALGDSAYLIDLGEGHGMVIHPERNTTPYLAEPSATIASPCCDRG